MVIRVNRRKQSILQWWEFFNLQFLDDYLKPFRGQYNDAYACRIEQRTSNLPS